MILITTERASRGGQALPRVPAPAPAGRGVERTRTRASVRRRGGEDVGEEGETVEAGEGGQEEAAAGCYGVQAYPAPGEM